MPKMQRTLKWSGNPLTTSATDGVIRSFRPTPVGSAVGISSFRLRCRLQPAYFIPHALRQPQHYTRLLSSLAACIAESQIVADGLRAAQEAERRHVPACAFARLASAKYFRKGGKRGVLSLFPPCSRRGCRRIMTLETTSFLKQTGIRCLRLHIACSSIASHV
jgi:hypothetical protein